MEQLIQNPDSQSTMLHPTAIALLVILSPVTHGGVIMKNKFNV
jgi:hypothetical protein